MIDPSRNQIRENLEQLQNLLQSNKYPISIIAVTKTLPSLVYEICHELGLYHIGENRVEELISKAEPFTNLFCEKKTLFAHIIGPLQSRKIKLLPEYLHSIDSVTSLDQLHKLENHFKNHESKRSIEILLQINTSQENQKNGFSYQNSTELSEAASFLDQAQYLNWQGLMTMGPTPTLEYKIGNKEYEKATAQCFQRLSQLQQRLQIESGKKLPRLSMGMSHDYRIAIQEGATELRIGSYLFGSR